MPNDDPVISTTEKPDKPSYGPFQTLLAMTQLLSQGCFLALRPQSAVSHLALLPLNLPLSPDQSDEATNRYSSSPTFPCASDQKYSFQRIRGLLGR